MKTYILTTICLLIHIQANCSEISKIAFGSCAHQDHPQPIWNAINKDNPDVFIMLGDNIYGDTKDPEVLKKKYEKLNSKTGFQTLKEQSNLVAIWDDHDYGMNDIGKDYVAKHESRKLFLSFFNEPEESPRWNQKGGIYTSYYWGESGKTIQLILFDTRWTRDDLNTVTPQVYRDDRVPNNMGPYSEHSNPHARMISHEQWQWFEQEIQKPADLRIIASGIQIFSDYTGWECWRNFPTDYHRLLEILEKHHTEKSIFISGDTHWAEFTKMSRRGHYPIWETTSSGLTQEWEKVSPNKHRIGNTTFRANYGLIEINWETQTLLISIKNAQGQIKLQQKISLSSLTYAN